MPRMIRRSKNLGRKKGSRLRRARSLAGLRGRPAPPFAPGLMALLGLFGQRQGHEAVKIDIGGIGHIRNVEPAMRHEPLRKADPMGLLGLYRKTHAELHRPALADPAR